ncbi:hypothetical protein DVA86_11180 [Streptomyces armeniacus]|uniref:CopG family transcriptional regulator n=1 Tax=Streptomyces armeniacus TaxID=83291 RepID=A0A345XNB1_9ACTN|nr:hypothetical protein [Streptomyces armeniacus]AXK33127.1 hypothetical protein DVA86_11180 [Streptomyces armeniacus]
MTATIEFWPTEEDARIIRAATREGETADDVIRRALRLLERELWLGRARAHATRLADEDVSAEADVW